MASQDSGFALSDNWEYLLLTIVIGMSVGVAELFIHFKGIPPFRGFLSLAGSLYFFIHGAAAAGSYFLLVYHHGEVFTDLSSNKLLASVVAGCGLLILLQFSPDLIISAVARGFQEFPLEKAVLRADQINASSRAALVAGNIRVLPSPIDLEIVTFLLLVNLATLQNLSEDEKESARAALTALKEAQGLTPDLKLVAISLQLISLVGEGAYSSLMMALRDHMLSLSKTPDSEVAV